MCDLCEPTFIVRGNWSDFKFLFTFLINFLYENRIAPASAYKFYHPQDNDVLSNANLSA